MHNLGWHFDFHSHKTIRIGHNPDPLGAARMARACGIDEIITFTKCHNGFAYYPTKIGTPHPRMLGDPFGDLVHACKAEGIRVLAYISFGLDGEAGRKHPEWAKVYLDGPVLSDDGFINVCPFTPYLNELMLPMIAELLKAYPIDGFFFDTMGALGVCYCEACQREFRGQHGLDIPREDKDPNWGIYGAFRRRRGLDMLSRIGRFITAKKPDAKVCFNTVGTYKLPVKPPEGITCLTLDFPPLKPQSLQASFCAAYNAFTGFPSDVMSVIFNNAWGDWTPRPDAGLEQEAVAVWARFNRPYIGDRLHPDNRLEPATCHAMQFLAKLKKRIEPHYPADDARLNPDALIIFAPRSLFGDDMRDFARKSELPDGSAGAHRLLLDAGANFGIVAEPFLSEERIGKVSLLIMPELESIELETADLLRRLVEGGKNLLVVGKIPKSNGNPMNWLGVGKEALPWQNHIYLPAWHSGDRPQAVMVRGDFYQLVMSGADAVLPAIRPFDCSYNMKFGHRHGPAEVNPSAYPALTRFRVGRGEVWYLEAPIFSDYAEAGNWAQFVWFRELLNRIIAEPVAQVESAAGSVEVVASANGQTTWAFLVNHGGEQLIGERRWSRVFYPPPAYPIVVRINLLGRSPRRVTVNGKPARWTQNEKWIVLKLKMNTFWKIVRVDWNV